MKSSTRLSIALVFSVTLLFSCSLLFWNAQAQISLEKVTIGDKFVRIQTGQGAPVIDVQLLENTDHCFTECYAILKIHPYQDITLPAGPNSEFAWNFVKDKPWMDGLISYHFEILETVEYAVDIPEYGAAKVNSTCYGQDNATYACKADQTIQTGSHQETRQSEEYKPFAFWGETLKADTDYTIKLAGEKSPSVKTNNIDWRPVIKGLELDEWEWWNTTWNKCRKIVNSSLSDFVSGYEAVFTFNNATIPYADFMSGFADLRITNGTECNGDSGSEMNFYINTIGMGRISGQPDVYVCNQSNTSASCSIFINMTLTNQTGFLMYYNASGVSSASNMIKVFTDSANFNNNNISDWTQSRGSNTWIAEGGVLKSDVISGDSWIYRNFISGRSTNNFILTFDFYRNDTQGGWVMLRNKAPPSSYMGFTIDSTSAYQSITWEYVNGSGGSAASLPGFSNLIWYNYALVVTNKFQNLTRNSTSLVNYTLSNPPSPFNLTTIGKGWTTAGRGVWFDNVIVRQYVSNPPSWSIGETETQYNIIIHSPENTTYNTSSINLNWSYSNMSSLEWAGYSLNDGNNVSLEAGLVYQESADSASCAGSWSNCGNTYDSDWESWGYSNEGSWVYFNYTKPSKAASANWTIKSGSHWGNHTVPEACFNSTVLQFGAYSFHGDGDQKISNWSCWNGIGWQSIYYEQSEYGDTVYEEAVWWLMENNFVNTTIIVQEGSNKLALCANDTGGGMACETVYFTVDLTPPSVSVTFPQNNGQYDLTWINVTGTAEDANPDSIWTNDSIFGQNVGTFQSWNFTNNSMKRGPYSVTIYANDSAGNANSTQLSFFIGKWNVTFNVTSGETGENLTNVNVNCNNSWSGTIDSWDVVEFAPGWWSCTFEKTDYYDKTIIFYANSDQTINVKMSFELSLTIEEHTWLESIYSCLINKDCDVYDLWNQTYEYASDIWDQFKQTDESVVVSEETTSSVVNDTSNLTIEYVIDVPVKEDYQFLPIRIFYWFMDKDNETCYNQAKDSNNAEAPFCNPLVAQTIGGVNTSISFTVDLRPSLPEGNYTVIRRIDIDPQNVWINYGHEAIGRLEVTEGSGASGIKLSMNGSQVKHGTQEPAVQATTQTEQQQTGDKSTGMITIQQIDSVSYVAVIVSVITLVLVGLLFKNSRKQNPWGN